MAFVAAATSVGAAVLGTGAAAGIGSTIVGGALIGAGVGGLYSAVTGDGNILNSMLTGGLIGGAAGGIGGAIAPQAAGYQAAALPSTAAAPTANVVTGTPALTGVNTPAGAALANASKDPIMSAVAMQGMSAPEIAAASKPIGEVAATGTGISGTKALGYGLAGSAALSLLGNRPRGAGAGQPPDPGMVRPYEFASTPTTPTGQYPAPYASTQYNTAGLPVLDTRERTYFNMGYEPLQPYSAKSGTPNPNVPIAAATGGLMAVGGPVERMSAMDQQRGMYPMGMMDKTYYATPTQRPASMEVVRSDYDTPVSSITGLGPQFAGGGIADLGSYSDGGRLLKGPGDGMSDNIPATIGKKQPARLADGEFVVPADVVSHLGNGSTDAGAKRLYAMMDKVRKARTGNKKQGKEIKAEKFLPA